MLYWISFATVKNFLGAVIIEADGALEAVKLAAARGLNPGGEALILDIPEKHHSHARRHMNHLYRDRAEVQRLFGPSGTNEEAAEVGAVTVCEKCNSPQ